MRRSGDEGAGSPSAGSHRVVAERFALERQAGSGGMGEVWRARDTSDGSAVAVKLLRVEAARLRARFEREAELLARLVHPAVVRHVAHGEDAGELYLAMEWLEGEDLAVRLARGPLTPDECMVLMRRVIQALAAAHELGVIHRDLKPSNVFLPGGRVEDAKLLDFGIAHFEGGSTLATRTGAVIGTPGFMSPEQVRGQADIDARSDLFSLGCVWLECLTGKPAFAGEHVIAVLAKVMLEEPAQLSTGTIPAASAALLRRLLAKDRELRPGGANQLLAELDAASSAPPRPALGRGELRRFFVVMALPGEEPDVAHATTEPHLPTDSGVGVERLVDGTWVGAISVGVSASDAAARVARAAFALARALPGARVSAATGRGTAEGRVPAGEVIERALRLARNGPAGIVVDDGLAGLLDARFELVDEGGYLVVARERPADEDARALLGRPTPIVGRDRELGILRATFASCVSDRVARVVLVTAPPGVGKSRLRRELTAQLATSSEAVEVWHARADSLGAGAPLALLAQLVRDAAGLDGSSHDEAARRRLFARVSRRLGDSDGLRVGAFLAEMAGLPVPDDTYAPLAAARRDPPLLAEQIQNAWVELVLAECRARPVAIILEDIHWGDWPSLRHIEAVLRRGAESPLFVLALARPEVHERFPGLWRDVGLEEIHLPHLPARAAERLVRHVLPEAADDDVARVVALAGGNSFYLEELIRALSTGRSDLPESVLAMAQGRYELLDDETRRVLRVAAVLGESFWSEAVREILGDAAPLERRLLAMAEQELIERRARSRFAGQVEYGFRHALLREAAYAALPEDELRVAHGLAADWLERAGEPDAATLGEHAERARDPVASARHFARAAEQALDGGDFDGALARVMRARGAAPDPATALALDLAEMEAYKWKGERALLVAAAARVVEQAAPGSSAWCRGFADCVPRFQNLPERERALAEVTPASGASADYVVCLARVLTQSCIMMRHAEVAPLFARMETLAAGDPSLEGWVRQARGFRAMATRDNSTAYVELSAAAASFERMGDERNALAQRGDACAALHELGLDERAIAELEPVVRRCEQLGLGRLAGAGRYHLAWLRSYREDPDEVRAALALMRAEDSPRYDPSWSLWCVVSALLRLGDLAEAENVAREAETLEVPGPDQPAIVPIKAELRLCRGDAAGALALLQGPFDNRSTLTDVECWGRHHRVRIEALLALGRVEEARAFVVSTMRELHEIVDAASDRDMRAGIVERVFELRRIAELARGLSAS
jgi:eukaryotic-like serine/threonine-protein kinase